LFHKRNRTRDPRVPEPKRSSLAIFNAACPFPSEFLVKVTFVSTRPGILRSRRILNHAKPSITAGGMKRRFQDIITGSLIIPLVKGLYLNVGTIKTSFQTEKVNDVANALILEMSKRLISYESKGQFFNR
jgi:hypothetical protein